MTIDTEKRSYQNSRLLTFHEREIVEMMYGAGESLEAISRRVGFSARFLKKEIQNYSVHGVYSARVAEKLAYQNLLAKFLEKYKISEYDLSRFIRLLKHGHSVSNAVKIFKEEGIRLSRTNMYFYFNNGFFDLCFEKGILEKFDK